jgi:ribulose-phosphate 3-epimerase
MNEIIIAPSLLAAQSDRYGDAIKKVEKAGAQYLHIDVMDGHFVPNLSFGPNIVSGIRAGSSLYFDVHLMITNPEKYALQFIQAGANCITVHAEAPGDIECVINLCNENNIDFGLSLKPGTCLDSCKHYFAKCKILLIMSVEPGFGGQNFMPEALNRIKYAKQLRNELNAEYKISVDGGIDSETSVLCIEAGVDILVAGTAIFNSDNPSMVIKKLMGVDIYDK